MNQGRMVEVGEELELTDELANHLVEDGVAVDVNEGLEVEVEVEKEKTANDYSRKELDAIAVEAGLNPKDYTNKNLLFDAIQNASEAEVSDEEVEEAENNTEDLGQEG